MKIKTRFAPSPTGFLHVGGARTALYSWLFARNLSGKFILRIENSDLERSTQKSIDVIIESMNWLNLDWDEGPYFQTQRLDRYNSVIEEMLYRGTAYRCFCSKERLESLRKTQISRGEKPRYDGYCRKNHKYHSMNDTYVVRFANPQDGFVSFNDLVRGFIKFKNAELDDLIIRRTNGIPTYNFCAVVDDVDMEITHVIRGEDHINNTPRQINILKALKAPIPNYAHLSMILGSDGKKFSKRHGSVGIMQYRDDGFLPEALLNYLLRLGWAHGDQEIFSVDEMKKLFKLEEVNKSTSIFNFQKLLWLNHYYINHLPNEYVATHLIWHVKQKKINTCNGPQLTDLVNLLRKNCKTLKEMANSCRYFYQDFNEFDIDSEKQYLNQMAIPVLQTVRAKLTALDEWTSSSVSLAIKETTKELQVDKNKVCMPLRVAITGVSQSPTIDAIIYTIGKSRSINRIDLALNRIVGNF